jgi:hypothetical protein
MLKIRNDGTIREIKTPSDKMEVMLKIQKSNVAEEVKDKIIKKFCGGTMLHL